jgi:methylated-DNA-protein-cysteine methyltransferase related protein
MNDAFEKIYSLVASVPQGKVATYGALAKLTKINPRVVGYILHQNKNPKNVPCHRVIKSNGKLATGFAFGGPMFQKKMLEKEGIIFKNETVDLTEFEYLFKTML